MKIIGFRFARTAGHDQFQFEPIVEVIGGAGIPLTTSEAEWRRAIAGMTAMLDGAKTPFIEWMPGRDSGSINAAVTVGSVIRFGLMAEGSAGALWRLKFEQGSEYVGSAKETRDMLQGWIDMIDGKPPREFTAEETTNFGLPSVKAAADHTHDNCEVPLRRDTPIADDPPQGGES